MIFTIPRRKTNCASIIFWCISVAILELKFSIYFPPLTNLVGKTRCFITSKKKKREVFNSTPIKMFWYLLPFGGGTVEVPWNRNQFPSLIRLVTGNSVSPGISAYGVPHVQVWILWLLPRICNRPFHNSTLFPPTKPSLTVTRALSVSSSAVGELIAFLYKWLPCLLQRSEKSFPVTTWQSLFLHIEKKLFLAYEAM